jgi:hypothetical protein
MSPGGGAKLIPPSVLPRPFPSLLPIQQAVINRVHHAACGVGDRLHVLLRGDVSSAVAKVGLLVERHVYTEEVHCTAVYAVRFRPRGPRQRFGNSSGQGSQSLRSNKAGVLGIC